MNIAGSFFLLVAGKLLEPKYNKLRNYGNFVEVR